MSTLETYRYNALDEEGNKVHGTEKARSCRAAHLMLLQRGLQPIDVKEHKSVLQVRDHEEDGLAQRDHAFLAQLSVFIEAGIPIMEALEVISEETTDKLLKQALVDMIGELQSGDTFASAAASHPEAFPRYYVAVLESAELTGTLDKVLLELAKYLETDIDARSADHLGPDLSRCRVRLAIVTVVVLAAFVLPKFRTFFSSLNAKLPLPTRMLLSMSRVLQQVVVGHRRRHHPGDDRTRRPCVARRRAGPGSTAVLLKLPVAGAWSRRPLSSASAASSRRWSPPASISPRPWP